MYLGAAVITFFLLTLAGFFSIRAEAREDGRLDEAARLARAADTDFQLAVSKGKNFAILKDGADKERALAYFREAQGNFVQLSKVEQDPQGRQLLYRLGAGLKSAEFPLGILTSTAQKSDSAEKLYTRYLKDITIDFDNASRGYLGFLDGKIQAKESDLDGKILLDLLLALAGTFLGLAGMILSLSIARNLNESLRSMQASQERFERFTEITKEGILIHENGIVVDLNQALAEMTGFRAVELVGTDGAAVLTKASAEKVHEFRKKGYPQDPYEINLRRKNGTLMPVEVHGRDFDFEGRRLRVASFWDLTERKKAEEALRRSEERFRAILDHSHEGITLVAEDGTAVYISPANKRLTGYEMEERAGRNVLEVVHPDDLPQAMGLLEELRKNPGKMLTAQLRLRHKSGEWLIGEITATNLLQNPDVEGILINFRDITEKVRAEETLRQSEEKFRNLIDNSYDVISITGKDRVMSYISPSVKRVLGYEPSERIGQGYAEIMHPDDVERIKEEFAKLRGKNGASWTVEFRLRHKDGSWRIVESTGTNLLENPSVQGIIYNLRDITERVEAQTALEHRERYFRSLIDKLYDVLMVMDSEGAVTYISPSVERVLGYTPGDLMGVKMIDLMHPDDAHRPGRIRAVQAAQMPGAVGSDRARLRHKDGSWRTVDYTGVSLVDDPAIKGVVTIFRDVTEQEKAENALRHSEENFRNLIEKSPDAILVNRDGKIVYANPKLLALLGYDEAEELLGKPNMTIVHPDDQKTVVERVQTLSEGRLTLPAEIHLVRRDGATLPAETASITIQFEGNPAIMVSLRDITARKQAEDAVRESQERYRSLVESMPDAVMVHDEENILYVNPSAVRMFGARSEEELLGKSFWVVVPHEFREQVRVRLMAVIESGAVNELAERKLKRLDGSLIDVLVTSVPFNDRGRRVVLAIFLDITALKEAERKAQKYQRLATLGEMAAGMAHEIRNPTAAISAQAQYLLKKLEGNSTAYEQLKDILQQCDRLETLVHDTLDYSPEKKFEERTEVPAKDLLQKALWLAQTQFGPSHARVKVILDVAEDMPPLKIHPTRMERVLVNLILNAFQAMPEGGNLLLGAKSPGNKVVLRVQDDGKGITDEEMTRLFEPFYTSRKMGSGLGLAICQKIAEEHQGQVRVERVEPHGAAFIIELHIEKESLL